MISPNCPPIMDGASTTSSFKTIERNVTPEQMGVNVGDSVHSSTENELLEDLNQDPEDEDTLSDDSLRLRLSDDEADDTEGHPTDEPTAPHVRSENTTSQDTAMGPTDSGKILLLTNETQSSAHKSCYPESDKEFQQSPHTEQIQTETGVGGGKNLRNMWRGGKHRESSVNSTANRTIKRSSRGHALHMRYNQSQFNNQKSPPYFNNPHHFGRSLGRRSKNVNRSKYPKQNYLYDSSTDVHGNTGKEQGSNPKAEVCSKPDQEEIEPSTVDRSQVCSSNSIRRSNIVHNDGDAASPAANVRRSVNRETETNTDVNIEGSLDSDRSTKLAKESGHPNCDKESGSGDGNIESPNEKDGENLCNSSYDPEFNCGGLFDKSNDTTDECVRSSHNSLLLSALSEQDSSKRKDIGSTSPVHGAEFVISTKSEENIVTDDRNLTEKPIIDPDEPCNLANEAADSDVVGKSNDTIVDGNVINDDVNTEDDVDRPGHEAAGESIEIEASLAFSKNHQTEVTLGESEKIEKNLKALKHQDINKDDAEVQETINQSDDNCEKQRASSYEKDGTSAEIIVATAVNINLPDEKKAAEHRMEIEMPNEVTENDVSDLCQENDHADVRNESSSAAESVLDRTQCLTNVEETEANVSVAESCELPDVMKSNSTETMPELKSDDNLNSDPLPVLKRNLADTDIVVDKPNHKKFKMTSEPSLEPHTKQFATEKKSVSVVEEKNVTTIEESKDTDKSLQYVRKFFQRDMKGKLSKLKREELEELIIQKLVETITMRSEIGRLREQARASERNQEATRVRCQQLSKQIKDFDMVLNRYNADRRSNNNKPVPPIKINRSVGLQVNFSMDYGIHSLRALTTNNAAKQNVLNPVTVNGGNKKTAAEKVTPTTPAPRRGIKVRSPRRIEKLLPVPQPAAIATPAALVISKPAADALHNSSVPNNSKEQSLKTAQLVSAKIQNIVNGKVPLQPKRQTHVPNNQQSESNDLIDLTEEEDKNKLTGNSAPTGILPMVGTVTSAIAAKVSIPRTQRVLQPTSTGNVASVTQPANIQVIRTVPQPTPTALVNNINTTRLAYMVQGTGGSGRPVLLAPNPNQIRPAASIPRGQFSNVTYKSGISTLANGSVRVITTAAPAISNLRPPPAPLPDTPHYSPKTGWKLPPPPPSLKISKVTQGIVLSWNMAQSDTYADIASYQLYAYQEIPGTPPNSNLWKKVGDVRALPLPMACTLKEFTPGNNYHFAVRAVDTHSRLGQYSVPKNISL